MNASAFYDVLVIGGGASGLAAAITVARVDKRVCVVERDVACGLKLLATGNGRCNLSNESIDIRRYNRPAFVESIMGPQPEQDLESFFSSLGIMTIREEGRLYPRSLRAESVRDAPYSAELTSLRLIRLPKAGRFRSTVPLMYSNPKSTATERRSSVRFERR